MAEDREPNAIESRIPHATELDESTAAKHQKPNTVVVDVAEKCSTENKTEEIAPFFGRAQNLHLACMLNIHASDYYPQRLFTKSMENLSLNSQVQLGTDEKVPESDGIVSEACNSEKNDEEKGRDMLLLSRVRSIQPEDCHWPFLLRFQVVSIGVSMGVCAHSILWQSLAESESVDFADIPKQVSIAYWILGVFLLFSIFSLYALKSIYYPAAVILEFRHPFRVNFFFGFTLSSFFLLLAVPEEIDSLTGRRIVFGISVVTNAILQVIVYGQWLTDPERSLSRFANPPYQIAIVGNFVAASVAISVDWRDIGLFFLGVGVAFQTIVLVSLFQRFDSLRKSIEKESRKERQINDRKQLLTRVESTLFQSINHPCRHEDFLTAFKNSIWDIPQDTSPVFYLFVAPPSAAASAFAALNGNFGDGPRMLLFFAFFLYLMFAVRLKLFLFAQKNFSLAWWAYTFPQAAVAGATISYATAQDTTFLQVLAFGLSIIAVAIQVRTMIATFWRFFMGTLFPIDGLLKPWASLAKHFADSPEQLTKTIDSDIRNNQHLAK